jgi:lia operon protein LiaG
LSVTNHNGKVFLTSVNADGIDVTNSEGPIHISGMKVLNARIRSVSGKISAAAEVLPAEMDIRNTFGAIDLAVPGQGSFSLNARSSSGQVSVGDIPVEGMVGEHQVSGVAGSNTSRERTAVLLKTGSGDITVRKL